MLSRQKPRCLRTSPSFFAMVRETQIRLLSTELKVGFSNQISEEILDQTRESSLLSKPKGPNAAVTFKTSNIPTKTTVLFGSFKRLF